jgi:hypothetical protein
MNRRKSRGKGKVLHIAGRVDLVINMCTSSCPALVLLFCSNCIHLVVLVL